jgi:hypothetical protein
LANGARADDWQQAAELARLGSAGRAILWANLHWFRAQRRE